MKNQRKLSLISVFFTFFVDTLCWSIVFPIFAPFFLNVHNPLFSSDVSESSRATMLGLFLMAFSLGQFFGAPLIGDYADRTGRKKALLLTIPSTLFGLLLTAWSMETYNLPFLFLGRLITGIFSSNGSICLASVADLSTNEENKTKNFGRFSAFAGLAFVLGAFIGGKLSDKTINTSFSPAFPLKIASIICVLNFFFVLYGFTETMTIKKEKKFSLFSCFKNIKTALLTKKIHNIYIVYFLFIFSWTILLQFIPVIMIKRYQFTESDIGNFALFVGIFWSIGSGILKQLFLKILPQYRLLKALVIMTLVLTASVTYFKHMDHVFAALGLCVIGGSIIWPICTKIISEKASWQMQGKVLSVSQSIQAFAMTLASIIGGLSFKGSIHIPFLIAAFAIFLSGLIVFREKNSV